MPDKIANKILTGLPASPGKISGKVRRINYVNDMAKELDRVESGDIIVTAMTHPIFLPAIKRAGGIVTDLGGYLCHAAIVARELKIPAVVGTQTATSILQEGQKIYLDGDEGCVYEY